MLKHILGVGLALGVALGPCAPIAAKEYNKRPFLPPSGQVKVNNTKAKLFVLEAEIDRKKKRANERARICRDERSGVAIDRSNPRREVIIATKDIVNLGGRLELGANCR